MKIQQQQEQMLFTVVRVEAVGNGSGVVIFSDRDSSGEERTLILTAKHVVKGTDEVDIVFYPNGEEVVGKVIKRSGKRDLALILVTGHIHPYVASLSTDMNPRVYSEVWKAGGGLSITPHPAKGMLTGVPKNHIQVDAGIIFGDSGGGIFIQDKLGQYHLTGIIVTVAMAGRVSPMPHIGMAHDIATIIRFINS